MNRREWLELAALGAAAPCLGAGQAQPAQQAQRADDDQVIRLDVTRVNILVTVADKKGRFVTNLRKEDFDLYDSRRKQNVIEFAAESELPLRIALLIDTSNSIKDRFKFELEAAVQFLESVVRKGQDRAIIYSYDTETQVVVDFTDDTEHLAKRMRELRPGGGTALYDAIYLSSRDKLMMDTPRYKFRRAMIIIGDGDDNASKVSREQALEMAIQADVSIYSISTNVTKTETDGDKILRYLSRETGGQSFFPFKAQDLVQDFENIANELRSQYSLLYRPEPVHADGLFHDVDIRIKGLGKGTIVRAKKRYFAPKM